MSEIKTAKKKENFFARHKWLSGLLIAVGVLIAPLFSFGLLTFLLDPGYAARFDKRDKELREKAEGVFSKVVVPPVLHFQSKKYITDPFFAIDYNPYWLYQYELKADKKTVYEELEKALIKACGPNTPDDPYSVTGDEAEVERYKLLGAQNCEEVDIIYELQDDKHATIIARPNLVDTDGP